MDIRALGVITAFGMILTFSASADDASSGCGLGWQVSKKNSLLSSSIRNTTNATSSNQTYGMTSGTSGCAKHSIVQNDKAPLHYTEANYGNLVSEMAQGKGEFLRTYAAVLGCSPAAFEDFSNMTRTHYSDIIPHDQVTPDTLLKEVRTQIKNDSRLAVLCDSFV